MNILDSGKALLFITKYLVGGSLTALMKIKEGHLLDIRQIAVGKLSRRLRRKCLCIISKEKGSEFFSPFHFGVACPADRKDCSWFEAISSRELEQLFSKLTLRMPLAWCHAMLFLMNVQPLEIFPWVL